MIHRPVESISSAFSNRLITSNFGALRLLYIAFCLAVVSAATAESTQVSWSWSGAVTENSFRVNARALSDGAIVRLIVSLNENLSAPVYSLPDTAISTTNNRIVQLKAENLLPGSVYFYGFEVNGTPDSVAFGRSRTFAVGPSSFTVALGSCAQTGSTHTVFNTIRSHDPVLFLHLGDLHYQNIAANNINLYRNAFETVLASPPQANLYREVPLAYIWDDHDYGPNNSDSTSLSRPAARRAYREFVPHYPLSTEEVNTPINYAFSIGRVRFIVCDMRSARSPAFSSDNLTKTMLGTTQKEWFKRQLLAANGRYPLIVWVNTLPWIGNTGDDGWHLYTHERREIANFIADNDIRGICMVSGDAHMLAIDDGTNSDYATSPGAAFPVFHAAALDQTGSIKGGPYSHGTFPGRGQFGLMSVTDDGDSAISVAWSGRNQNDVPVVQYSFTVPVRNIVCGDANGDGTIQLSDVTYLIDHIFSGGVASPTLSNGDADGNLYLTVSDAVTLLRHLLFGGPAPTCHQDNN